MTKWCKRCKKSFSTKLVEEEMAEKQRYCSSCRKEYYEYLNRDRFKAILVLGNELSEQPELTYTRIELETKELEMDIEEGL